MILWYNFEFVSAISGIIFFRHFQNDSTHSVHKIGSPKTASKIDCITRLLISAVIVSFWHMKWPFSLISGHRSSESSLPYFSELRRFGSFNRIIINDAWRNICCFCCLSGLNVDIIPSFIDGWVLSLLIVLFISVHHTWSVVILYCFWIFNYDQQRF
jgi:hypothetical protein